LNRARKPIFQEKERGGAGKNRTGLEKKAQGLGTKLEKNSTDSVCSSAGAKKVFPARTTKPFRESSSEKKSKSPKRGDETRDAQVARKAADKKGERRRSR